MTDEYETLRQRRDFRCEHPGCPRPAVTHIGLTALCPSHCGSASAPAQQPAADLVDPPPGQPPASPGQ